MITAKQLKRLQNLVNLESSARTVGSFGEADACAALIEDLRAKYNYFEEIKSQVDAVKPEDVEEAMFDKNSEHYRSSRQLWEESLLRQLAALFDCAPRHSGTGNVMIVRGDEENRRQVKESFFHISGNLRRRSEAFAAKVVQERSEKSPARSGSAARSAPSGLFAFNALEQQLAQATLHATFERFSNQPVDFTADRAEASLVRDSFLTGAAFSIERRLMAGQIALNQLISEEKEAEAMGCFVRNTSSRRPEDQRSRRSDGSPAAAAALELKPAPADIYYQLLARTIKEEEKKRASDALRTQTEAAEAARTETRRRRERQAAWEEQREEFFRAKYKRAEQQGMDDDDEDDEDDEDEIFGGEGGDDDEDEAAFWNDQEDEQSSRQQRAKNHRGEARSGSRDDDEGDDQTAPPPPPIAVKFNIDCYLSGREDMDNMSAAEMRAKVSGSKSLAEWTANLIKRRSRLSAVKTWWDGELKHVKSMFAGKKRAAASKTAAAAEPVKKPATGSGGWGKSVKPPIKRQARAAVKYQDPAQGSLF